MLYSIQCYAVVRVSCFVRRFRINLVPDIVWASTAPVSYVAIHYIYCRPVGPVFLTQLLIIRGRSSLNFLLMCQVFLDSGPQQYNYIVTVVICCARPASSRYTDIDLARKILSRYC